MESGRFEMLAEASMKNRYFHSKPDNAGIMHCKSRCPTRSSGTIPITTGAPAPFRATGANARLKIRAIAASE